MSMFANAKTLKTSAKAKKSDKEEIMIEGLEAVASLDAVIKSLTALKATMDADVKEAMLAHFVTSGAALKRRPDNFRGIENNASASCELRARSSASKLSDSEIELLTTNNIPTEVVVDTVETFVINPEYLSDAKVMASIEKALKKVKDIPEDLFLKQEGKSKTIVSDGAMAALFSSGDNDKISDLLSVVSVLAIKPKLENDDLNAAFAIAKAFIAE